ncbi:MAG: hypothetical protein Kow00107_01070 [Planctomycetota bacterium]
MMFDFFRSSMPKLTERDFQRIEKYRRCWLYFSSPDGDPYRSEDGTPDMAAFKELPEYVSTFFNYAPFVVSTDLHLLNGDFRMSSLSVSGGVRRTNAVHKFLETAGLPSAVREAMLTALVCGDAWLKVIPALDGPGARIVAVDPAAVHPRLDPHDYTVEREIVVHYAFRDLDDSIHRRTEKWSAQHVEVWQDGVPLQEETGPNPLGRIPFVHFAACRVPGSYFGRSCFEDIVADMDKLNSALGAVLEVYRYYGSPKLVLKGVMAPEIELDPDVRQFWQIPSGDAELSFLEWRNATGLLDELLKLDAVIRRKLPEFILERVSERSYQSSGFALSIQLSLLDAKIQGLATEFGESVGRAARMALEAAGLSSEGVRFSFSPHLSTSWREKADAVEKLLDMGVMAGDEARKALSVDEFANGSQ